MFDANSPVKVRYFTQDTKTELFLSTATTTCFRFLMSEIPRNPSGKVILIFLLFQAKHAAEGNTTWGVNGETGEITDMNELGVWDTYSVKAQTLKTSIEVS